MVERDFELDYETISQTRTTVKDTITAAKKVTGDMVYPDNYVEINIPKKDTVGSWDFED